MTVNRATITDDDKNPAIQFTAWLLLSFTTLGVSLKFTGRFILARHRILWFDDFFILLSWLFAVLNYVLLTIDGSRALGRRSSLSTDAQIENALKYAYAAALISTSSLAFAKASILAALKPLTPISWHSRAITILFWATLVYLLTCEFLQAFQCSLPSSWDILGQSCLDIVAIQTYCIIANIVTELGYTIVAISIVFPLKMPAARKLPLIMSLGSRVLVIAAAIVQLIYVKDAFSEDLLFSCTNFIICSQIVLCLSLITASLPQWRPFLNTLQTGMMKVDKFSSFKQSLNRSVESTMARQDSVA